ncbi:gamma-glutamyl-gamma-aminobutyrate hydrolase family protein [Telmatospirillum sp.]|uniref:gamma-glutamyl-gamma-aminobutyrate hydrolase family protein n=1 Tax=Telmatospirillum sp. TaxID=2079197 RepID=UPI002849A6B2|nr:gamma-glutamyl-gamma-aminobutyrate hydrolase family protein [Telmatospirillum sp.]MDR3435584.1 gamma-glutamyl-gamma-aminobutyrate hydrolase family protein [Telmatospirillum sp.]
MRLPIIGITLDSEPPGGYAAFPWYALRQNYCDAIGAAGGLPVALPHHPDLAESYLDRLDGLLITGGAFDVDPALWGARIRHPSVTLKSRRTDFELAIVNGALARDLPLFGICGGEQLLAVALGCRLIQHIPDEIAAPLAHEQPNPRDEPSHAVTFVAGTRLAAIAGCSAIAVNSAHHQAVGSVPAGIAVNARADDGVIEGIEDSNRRFCLGVQWHPEFAISPSDRALFHAFIEAAHP